MIGFTKHELGVCVGTVWTFYMNTTHLRMNAAMLISTWPVGAALLDLKLYCCSWIASEAFYIALLCSLHILLSLTHSLTTHGILLVLKSCFVSPPANILHAHTRTHRVY